MVVAHQEKDEITNLILPVKEGKVKRTHIAKGIPDLIQTENVEKNIKPIS